MKFLGAVIFFCFFLFKNAHSANPGANYACWSWGNNKFYTSYWKDDIYPGWGSTIYHYYDDNPKVYDGNYSGTPPCDQLNVNNPGAWMPGADPGGQTSCFIRISGSITQGNLGRLNYTSFACPIDDYIWILISLVSVIVFFKLKYKIS